jgi:hypothetical protein
MVALIATLTLADILRGEAGAEAAVGGASRNADGVARLHVVRRIRR